MGESVCPRCQVAVVSVGDEPRCEACDYPGPDTRPEAEQHPQVAGDDRVLSGKAVASMVLGITSVTVPVAGLATGITAIPLALKARREIRDNEPFMSGRKHANAGLVLGVIGIAAQAALFGGTIASWYHRLRD